MAVDGAWSSGDEDGEEVVVVYVVVVVEVVLGVVKGKMEEKYCKWTVFGVAEVKMEDK